NLVAAEAGLAQTLQISAHAPIALFAERVQIVPAIEPGVVPIVEYNAHGVAADRLGPRHVHAALAADGACLRPVPPLFRGRAFHAQQLIRNLERRAAFEADRERACIAAEHELRRPGLIFVAHSSALSSRASSAIRIGTPSRTG